MLVPSVTGQPMPISPLALARELGHRDSAQLERTYFHDSRTLYALTELDYGVARDLERAVLEGHAPARRVVLTELPDPPCLTEPDAKGRHVGRARLWRAYQAGLAARATPPDAVSVPRALDALVPARLASRAPDRDRLLVRLGRAYDAGRSGVPWLKATSPTPGQRAAQFRQAASTR